MAGVEKSARIPSLRRLMGIQVLATAGYVPEPVVTNADLHACYEFDPDWIVQRTGIRERRHAPADIATSDLAYEAGRRCLQAAGVDASEVDLVLVGTFTPDMSCPSVACMVQDRLGVQAPAVDLQAACAGFMYSLVTAAQFVATGCSRYALVIGADCNSRILNPKDLRTYPLFGDGAGAVLLSAGDRDQGLVAYELGSDGAGGPLLQRPIGGTRTPFCAGVADSDLRFLQMDGRSVFKWAIRMLEESITHVLRHAEMSVDQLDLVVLHQANVRILDAAAEALGIDRGKLMINLDRYGNTSGGSVPLALAEAVEQGRVKRGQNILLSGFGAGLAWGTAIVRW